MPWSKYVPHNLRCLLYKNIKKKHYVFLTNCLKNLFVFFLKVFLCVLKPNTVTGKPDKTCIKCIHLVTVRPLSVGQQCPTGWNGG